MAVAIAVRKLPNAGLAQTTYGAALAHNPLHSVNNFIYIQALISVCDDSL
jgi:hypothetical protein